MTAVLVIIGIIVLLCLFSVGGWIMEGLSYILGIFMEGLGNCLGNTIGCILWIIVAMIVVFGLAAL